MATGGEVKKLLKDGKNGTSLLCQRCSSVILRPNLAVFTEKEVNMADFCTVVKFDFTADLTGTGNRSEEVIK